MTKLTVHKGRTEVVLVSLGFDASDSTFESEIRTGKSRTSELIAAWDIAFITDGTDGELSLTLDDTVTNTITHSSGFMDLKRITGGEPVSVFENPLHVVFKEVVTV